MKLLKLAIISIFCLCVVSFCTATLILHNNSAKLCATEKIILQYENTDSNILFDESVDNLEIYTKFELTTTNDPTLYQTEYFSTYYFNNLNENMGFNYIGSCSYVAVAMMLSYYDTYWNDAIIEESYEQNSGGFNRNLSLINKSPGIKEDCELPFQEENRLGLSGDEKLSYGQYYTLVMNNVDNSLHYRLMKMGREEEIYKLYLFFDQNPFGLGEQGRESLMNSYLYDYMGFSNSEIYFETITDNIESYIISKVTQGIPVLIAVEFPDETGHAFVVYDYDASTGRLFGNMGWGYGDTHVDLSSMGYTRIKNATTFILDGMSHSHSNNYVD